MEEAGAKRRYGKPLELDPALHAKWKGLGLHGWITLNFVSVGPNLPTITASTTNLEVVGHLTDYPLL